MTPQPAAPKGRLEQLLDEFSEVHGTVLMGMHKELQTLKTEVKAQVESQIGNILKETKSADNELARRLSASKEIGDLLVEKSKKVEAKNLKLIEQAHQMLGKIESKLASANSDLDEQHKSLKQNLQSVRDTALADMENISKSITQERAAFRSEAASSLQNMTAAIESAQQKMSAALNFANTLNLENQALLQSVRDAQVVLHQKELLLQKRTQQVAIAIGLAIVATLGFWIWLTLKH